MDAVAVSAAVKLNPPAAAVVVPTGAGKEEPPNELFADVALVTVWPKVNPEDNNGLLGAEEPKLNIPEARVEVVAVDDAAEENEKP